MDVTATLAWSEPQKQPGLHSSSWVADGTEMAAIDWISVNHSRVGLNGPADGVRDVLRRALAMLEAEPAKTEAVPA